jgi:hypothetical protein
VVYPSWARNGIMMSNQIQFTKKDIELEKIRRKKEKSEELQSRFSPYTENGFWEFCKWYAPDFYNEKREPLKRLCGIFQDVALGKLKKVLITVFRRFGKSRTTSMWIAWQLIYYPDATFMRNCYAAPLAIDLSKKTMDIIESAKFKEIVPHIRLDPKQSSKAAWQIDGTEITTYFGTGIEGSIIGKGCKTAAILDDPIKSPQEAMSETFLENLELFIESVHNTCIDPSSECAQIIISTRWVENDPIGQRIDDPSWTQFIFPALDENNKSICEDIISTEQLLLMKKSWHAKGMGWMFESMYQCQPVTNLVSKFNAEELRRFKMEDLPNDNPDKIIAFLDYANKGSDFLSMPIAYCWGADRYIVDILFSDKDSKQLRPMVISKILHHKPETVTCETNQGGQEFVEMLEMEAGNFFDELGIEIIPKYSTTNKEIRILVRTGEIKSTCLFLDRVEQDYDYRLFFEQLINYGKIKRGHDDAPDSMSGLVGELSDIGEVDVECFGVEKKLLDNIYHKKFNDMEEEENDVIIF